MDETGIGDGSLSGLMVGMIGMFLLALIIISFVLVYQRKLLKQKRQQELSEIEYQRALLEANVKSQEMERQRIARDLHDGVGVMLSTTQLYFDQLSEDIGDEHEETKQKINELLEDTIQSVRLISADLRPVVLDNLGLAEAILELTEKVASASRLDIEFTNQYRQSLKKEQELVVFRIVQELLTNTIRHAKASMVNLSLVSGTDDFRLTYRDDGIGFDPRINQKGLGLKNIESRVHILGGEFIIHTHQQSGAFIGISIQKDEV